jgi:hypothetical protein
VRLCTSTTIRNEQIKSDHGKNKLHAPVSGTHAHGTPTSSRTTDGSPSMPRRRGTVVVHVVGVAGGLGRRVRAAHLPRQEPARRLQPRHHCSARHRPFRRALRPTDSIVCVTHRRTDTSVLRPTCCGGHCLRRPYEPACGLVVSAAARIGSVLNCRRSRQHCRSSRGRLRDDMAAGESQQHNEPRDERVPRHRVTRGAALE